MYVNYTLKNDQLSQVNDTITNDAGTLEVTRVDTNSIIVSFANEISITANISLDILDYSIELPEEYFNKTCGLLGNYNGNSMDDVMDINGIVANLTNDTDIYEKANSCMSPNCNGINNISILGRVINETSLFVSPNPNPDPSFKPTSPNNINASKEIISACEGNVECIYDSILTNNVSIGKNTLKADQVNAAEVEQISKLHKIYILKVSLCR